VIRMTLAPLALLLSACSGTLCSGGEERIVTDVHHSAGRTQALTVACGEHGWRCTLDGGHTVCRPAGLGAPRERDR
jgi:hypothetical protein